MVPGGYFLKNASLPVMLLMSKVTQGELRTILNMQNNIRNERKNTNICIRVLTSLSTWLG
ncbi:hypothetical protein [Escherichia coli ISC7]|uniref:Uncharacterized protein n=1 Tax=Escherichia coli ISC7 TaxID=1432555 RepID=W1F6Y6_ECOLX|nr:hypothetical protein [Escherichia coli ISC7]